MSKLLLSACVIIAVLLLLYYVPGAGTPPAASPRTYAGGIEACRRMYHEEAWSRGRSQINAVLDMLISDLVGAGESASDETKMACFRRAETALNALYDSKAIGTEDAAKLFYLGQIVAMSAKLDFMKFAKRETPSPLVVGREWPNGPTRR